MKTKTRILLTIVIIIAPVIIMLIPPTMLFLETGENTFFAMLGPISFWLLGIVVGYGIRMEMKKSKTNTAATETSTTKQI